MDLKTSEEKKHATFSASGAERWMNCSGSVNLCAGMPPQPESEYAAEGTRAHACFEFLLKNRLKLVEAKRIALKTYPLEMVEYAQDAVNWIVEQPGVTADNVLSEMRVDATPFTTGGQFGTLDAAIVRDFDRLTVIDYKYGAGVAVDPTVNGDCNPQLCYYALGLSYLHNHNFSEIELVVIQPRAYHESGETVRTAVFPMNHILEWAYKFADGVQKAVDPLAPLNAGRWCKWCPASLVCPELKENAMKQAQIVFKDSQEIESVPVVTMLTPDALGKALLAADKLEAFIDGLRKHSTNCLERGIKIPGWKLVQKRSIRKWVSEEHTANEALLNCGTRAFTKPELLSPAQLEKVLGKDWVNFRTVSESSGTTMVHESDKRPEVKPIEKVFQIG